MSFIKKQIRRLSFALKGIHYAIRTDKNFRLQWYGIGTFLLVYLYFIAPLSKEEWLFSIMAYILILITELQNSALEYALDHLHPEIHEKIGRSKDMAAGAVLLAGLFLLVVILIITISRF